MMGPNMGLPILSIQVLLQAKKENQWKKERARPLKIWQYWLWSFQGRDTKLERILHKNQDTQRKFLNFENWTSGEPQ